MNDLKKILVPVDFSDASKAAIEMALGLARKFGGQIDALHVVEYPVWAVPEMSVAVPGIASQSFEVFAFGRAEEEMRKLVESLRMEAGDVPITAHVIRGEAMHGIINSAKDGNYDLIVMGTHGRTGLEHVLLGSVAERVLRRAPCAVLTTRAPSAKAA